MIDDVLKKLNNLRVQGLQKLAEAGSLEELELFRTEFLARKGALNNVFKEFAELGESVRSQAGKEANAVKSELEARFVELAAGFSHAEQKDECDFDETIPGTQLLHGTVHPITHFIDKITSVFASMGYEIVEDREVETVEYNFDKLNIPENHPARDMWDTFYIQSKKQNSSDSVLRTHTSPVQLRAMEKRVPPVRLIVPGRCYRHEATDASHEINFYQLEGLVIDKGVSVAHLIYVVDHVLKNIFGSKVTIQLRPSFFPFVEPGHEIDMSCILCNQKGCSVCSKTGWLEMMGAGMVHPTVLKNMNVDPEEYSGFAFGMGIDRLMMLYYGVDDIRLSYSGDLRFLKQFS